MALFTDRISTQSTRVLALGLIALCAACAGPNLALQQAQQDYDAARQDQVGHQVDISRQQ